MKEITPNEAWVRSLPKVLLLPVGGWLVLWICQLILGGGGGVGDLIYIALAASIGLLIHSVSYFLVGLPFHLIYWKGSPRFWEWPSAIPVGILLGVAAIALMGMAAMGLMELGFGSLDSGSLAIGGIYGGLTAVGAVWSRKTL